MTAINNNNNNSVNNMVDTTLAVNTSAISPEGRIVQILTDAQEFFSGQKTVMAIVFAYANTLKHIIDTLNALPSKDILEFLSDTKTIELIDGAAIDGVRFRLISDGFPKMNLLLNAYRPGTISGESFSNVENFINTKILQPFGEPGNTHVCVMLNNFEGILMIGGTKEKFQLLAKKVSLYPLDVRACIMQFVELLRFEYQGGVFGSARVLLPDATDATLQEAFDLAATMYLFPQIGKLLDELEKIEPLFIGNCIKHNLDRLMPEKATVEVIEEKKEK